MKCVLKRLDFKVRFKRKPKGLEEQEENDEFDITVKD